MNRLSLRRMAFNAQLVFLFCAILLACSGEKKETYKFDNYGGWTNKKLTKTGYFHTEHDGDRWWFVTPEGNAFLSWGINHYHDSWWNQEYNKDHWNNVFGAKEYADKEWYSGFRNAASTDLKRLGINTLGWHTDAPCLIDQPYAAIVPYFRSFKPIVLDHYRSPKEDAFVDVFDTEFEKLCDEKAKEIVAPYANDSMLLGYAMSDCPIFTDNDIEIMSGKTSWSRIIRNLGADAPGKKVYVDLMKKHYSNIKKFNRAYKTEFVSWADLAKAENWRPNIPPQSENEKVDNLALTLLCIDKYYAVSKAAIRKYDSNHLFVGDKLNGNTDNLEKSIEVAAKYVDVIVYQFYGSVEEQKALLDKFTPKVDKPFVNGDVGFSVAYGKMHDPYGPHAKNQAERAKWLIESVEGCFARPEFIGWHMCGIIDTWNTMPTKEINQHQGLMTVTGDYYPEMQNAVKEIANNMYKVATQN